MAHGLIALLWLLHWLPLRAQAKLGAALGFLLWHFARSRRRVALRNIELCLHHQSSADAILLAKKHFTLVARSFLERGLLWFASEARLRR